MLTLTSTTIELNLDNCIYEMIKFNIEAELIPLISKRRGLIMAESVYKFIELVGTSDESWEKAAANAVEMAAKTLRDLRIAEVVEQDIQIENGKVATYRTKIVLSFRVEKAD